MHTPLVLFQMSRVARHIITLGALEVLDLVVHALDMSLQHIVGCEQLVANGAFGSQGSRLAATLPLRWLLRIQVLLDVFQVHGGVSHLM